MKKQKFSQIIYLLITACKLYCPAAGATQGSIAYTLTVSVQDKVGQKKNQKK